MGRVCYPNLYNHKLDALCDYLQLDLEHHNAGSDSRACAELLLDYMRHGLKPDRFLRRYDLAQRRTLRTPPKKLFETVGGTLEDGILEKSELDSMLFLWSNGNYGTKVKKALEMQEKGLTIRIVKEQDVFDLLSN